MATTIKDLRNRILEVAYRDGMGHIPSALSILDIIWCLYDKVMTKDDQFILSKGHGCMALYAVLEAKGLFDWSTKAQGHPKRGGAILASTGSLGHGLPMAVGLAMAKKIKGEPGRVFVLVGDGECNEGTTWESALLAAHHKLDNLVVIVDQNKSSERALSTGSLEEKFRAFGWYSSSFTGHDIKFGNDEFPEEWDSLLDENKSIRPRVIVSYNEKGHGIPFMQDLSWHNRKLTLDKIRPQFSKTVVDLLSKDERIVVLLGDIGVFAFKEAFEKYPTRVYNMGICEQTLVGMAAGLSMAGFIPIIHTIEPFLVERAFEQIKDDFGYQELCGTIVGVDVSQTAPNLGYTHQCPYALQMMSFVKNMNVFEPKNADDFDTLLKERYDKGLNYFRIS